MKRIKNWCASSRQHTLPAPVDQAQRIRQRRAASRRVASRSKPPNLAPGTKLALCVSRRIACRRIRPTVAMPFVGCAEQREAHQKLVRFLSSAHPTRTGGSSAADPPT
nr:hypothetical protein [Methylomarinum sp. Ch1-1]MDP4521034.1 hypothetical protein [Methylomarinum sp. Ch1-1]